MSTQLIGKKGEERAQKYLQELGYRILDKNFRSRFGEIDLIALDSSTLVFIEVKTRTTLLFGHPSEAIQTKKLKKLLKTSQYYQILHRNLPALIRFDAVEIIYSYNNVTINHIKNITL